MFCTFVRDKFDLKLTWYFFWINIYYLKKYNNNLKFAIFVGIFNFSVFSLLYGYNYFHQVVSLLVFQSVLYTFQLFSALTCAMTFSHSLYRV